jgi:hypothetical protein
MLRTKARAQCACAGAVSYDIGLFDQGGSKVITRIAAAVASSVLFATCAAAAASRPAVDVVIDDTAVYPESVTSMSDGTLINASVKGIV